MKRVVIFFFLFSAGLSVAEAINISGKVKNSAGAGLEGVRVRLGKAAITAITDKNGQFTIINGTGLLHNRQNSKNIRVSNGVFRLAGNSVYYSVSGTAGEKINVNVFDCKGRLEACASEQAVDGSAIVAFPKIGEGIYIYRISVGNDHYVFRHVVAAVRNNGVSSYQTTTIPGDFKTEASEKFDDAILFIKEGYKFCRIEVKKPDTSGIEVTMTPLDTGTVTDVEGNVYRTVKIGNQIWTAENLRTTKYNDGSSIGSNFHFYNNTNDATAKKKWGALYNWTAASSNKLAPAGWRVPTKADWDTLENYLITHGYNYDGTTKENKIGKALAATTDWEQNEETGAIGNDLSLNNASGFSALPAGYRYYTGEYLQQKAMAYFWTATQYDASFAWHRSMWSINFDFYSTNRVKTIECSVRLVKNN